MDRKGIAQALAKAQAYTECGKPEEARKWTARLVELLEAGDILLPEHRGR
ncbi:hypothetical protein [Sphingomonas desiccabilis]|nr:hypothetical protein [Sphingomonas desiccabilis]MBB3910145.1 hypothetical protein [Sphingomonas desiccabilis]